MRITTSDILSHGIARRARHGVAMMMVLSVVAAASVLAWAMLASSTMHSQIDDNAVDAVEAVSIAESGVSYAMHCLHYPDRGRPSGADATTWFYPGELGLKPWSDARGTVDITVTNTGYCKYKIRATATVSRGSSFGAAKHTVEANVSTQLQGIVNAAGFNGGFTIPSPTMHIIGPVVATGAVGNFSTQVTGSPALVISTINVVPPASQVALLVETAVQSTATGATANDRTYTVNGNTYIAEKAPATITLLGLTTLRPSLNPYNVWYSNSNVTLSGATFNGTLVLQGSAILGVSGTNTVTAPSGLPALVVGGNIDLKSTSLINAKLNVTGAVWTGGNVTATTLNRSTAAFKVDGALLMGATSPQVNVIAAVDVTYTSSAVGDVRRLSTVPTITGVIIDSWKSVD